LADKTGGWKIFVQPKLLFGTMILGFGVAACNSAGKAKNDDNTAVADTIETAIIDDDMITCYEPAEASMCYETAMPPDTTEKKIIKQKTKKTITPKATEPEPETMCYDIMVDCYVPAHLDEPIREQPIDTDTTDKVYDFVPVKARFPGGDQALMKWINDNINYPESAKENGIQGKVFVRFVVRKDGRIDGVKIGRGVHPSLDNEAIRLVKAMPKWIAGENNNGQKVSSYFTFPVTFVLK